MLTMEIIENADITKLNTLRVVSKADKLALPSSIEEVQDLINLIKENNLEFNILGAGSNTLLSSRPLKGILISTNNLDFINRIDETSFEVGAGLRMPRFCAKMTQESLSGTEFMEGIPGSIGGGVVMNAGAHGSEIKDILKEIKVLNLESNEIETWRDELQLSYRRSNINPKTHLVLSATFELEPGDKEEIRKKVQENNKARTTHQPIKEWTCGCTFQNPEPTISAGKLIDELGLKGHRVGDFLVSDLHGNFFENHGDGTSFDFIELMKHVQQTALEKKNIVLKPEVKPMGDFSKEELKLWSL